VYRHTGGQAHDDMALLLLENGAPARHGADARLPSFHWPAS
jgi:hypothetical protein